VKKILLLAVIFVLIVSVSVTSISAQFQTEIPIWVKGVANFWVEGNISDSDFGESISFLIEQKIIQVEMPNTDDKFQDTSRIRDLVVENKKLEAENRKLKNEISILKNENRELNSLVDSLLDSDFEYSDDNYLDNGCPNGYPYIWSDGQCHTTTEPNCLANKPYFWSDGFCYSSPEFLDNGCSSNYPYLWSDGQCHTTSEPSCSASHPYYWSDGFCYNEPEFYDNGCPNGYPYIWSDNLCHTIPESSYNQPTDSAPSCDESYPDVCIPPYPPDLDCDEIYYSNFRVIGSDPHGFDKDNDGIGCEVGSPQSSAPTCDPSYPDVCIPPYPPDLNCGDIGYSNFRVIGDDPHGFDGDNDGIGCES